MHNECVKRGEELVYHEVHEERRKMVGGEVKEFLPHGRPWEGIYDQPLSRFLPTTRRVGAIVEAVFPSSCSSCASW